MVAVEIATGMKAWGHKHLLHLAMENLLNNVWKFSSLNGQARIEVGKGATFYFTLGLGNSGK